MWPSRSDATVVSYGELNARANRLAHHLIGLGVSRGDVVGIHLERSVDMVVAVLAVLKAGAAYVPLDPALPAERLTFMVDETGAQVVISTRARSLGTSSARLRRRTLVLLDRDAAAIAACPSSDPGVRDRRVTTAPTSSTRRVRPVVRRASRSSTTAS